MIRLERDTHGRTYQIWQQQQSSSCGVASVWMARGIARQMSFNQSEWDLANRIYQGAVAGALASVNVLSGAPRTLDTRAFANNQNSMENTVATFGLFSGQVATALRNEGLRVQHTNLGGNPPRISHDKIAYNRPAIVLVGWTRGGGHFVVVGRCTQNEVSFLDPWNGHINQQRNDGQYRAPYGQQGRIIDIIYISA